MINDQLQEGKNEQAKQSVNIIQKSAGEMVQNLNDLVWMINPNQDTLQKLIDRLEEYAINMASVKDIHVKVNLLGQTDQIQIPVESRRNVYLFCKEAINNAVKYSNATILELTVKEVNGQLEFSISDNGKGFDEVMVRRGNGLENMQKRADEIGAKLKLKSKQNEGTSVSLQFKIT
jgi:signal transduction histidine kinase